MFHQKLNQASSIHKTGEKAGAGTTADSQQRGCNKRAADLFCGHRREEDIRVLSEQKPQKYPCNYSVLRAFQDLSNPKNNCAPIVAPPWQNTCLSCANAAATLFNTTSPRVREVIQCSTPPRPDSITRPKPLLTRQESIRPAQNH